VELQQQRRALLRRTVHILAVAAGLAAAAPRSRAAERCENADSESLRDSLHYTDNFKDPAQACRMCGFFTAQDEKPPCGDCMILSGPVNAQGHCDSWSAKS